MSLTKPRPQERPQTPGFVVAGYPRHGLRGRSSVSEISADRRGIPPLLFGCPKLPPTIDEVRVGEIMNASAKEVLDRDRSGM